MASTYKPKGTRYWWGRVQRDGRIFRKSLKTTVRSVAEKRLAAWREELDAIGYGEQPARTYDEAMLHFLEGHVPTLKPSSQRRYRASAKGLTVELTGLPLHRITSGRLSDFEAIRRGQGASAPTIRRDLACLSSMFETVILDWDLEIPNPVPIFLKKRAKRGQLKESPPRVRYLDHEEETRLIAHASPYLRPMIIFAIDTGLRLEEQLSLVWAQVNLQRREISLTVTKTGTPRRVPILPRTLDLLEHHPRFLRSEYVFHKQTDGSRFGKLTRGLAGAAKRAKIKNLRWHDLRRTCGCRLLQDHGLSMEQVGKWLGHKLITQTQRAYAFLEVDQLHAAIQADKETVKGRADENS